MIDSTQSATKNDSQAELFKIRELANASMTNNIHNVFKTVKSCSVTLDKVTTTQSYQVRDRAEVRTTKYGTKESGLSDHLYSI
jgi:hypothetical protein